MFRKMWNKIKSISYDWLPLAGIVTVLYMIQRGFTGIAKAGVVDVDLMFGMKIFFTTVALTALAIGFLSDRIKPSILLAAATVAGMIGIASGASNMWLFGIGAGIAGAAVKILSFAAPLKNKDTNVESLRIAPQAAAKNIGAGLFFLAVGAVLKTWGFDNFLIVAACAFGLLGTWAVAAVKNHRYALLKWKLPEVLSVLKNWKFWVWTGWYSTVAVMIYTNMPKIIPGFMSFGLTKAAAISVFGMAAIAMAACRWPAAYLGMKIGYFNAMLVGFVGAIANLYLVPNHPAVGIPTFFIFTSLSTPNMWPCAKEWFGNNKMGTGIGMAFILAYIVLGFSLGRW